MFYSFRVSLTLDGDFVWCPKWKGQNKEPLAQEPHQWATVCFWHRVWGRVQPGRGVSENHQTSCWLSPGGNWHKLNNTTSLWTCWHIASGSRDPMPPYLPMDLLAVARPTPWWAHPTTQAAWSGPWMTCSRPCPLTLTMFTNCRCHIWKSTMRTLGIFWTLDQVIWTWEMIPREKIYKLLGYLKSMSRAQRKYVLIFVFCLPFIHGHGFVIIQVMRLLQRGNKARTTEPTAANKTSSRSHALLMVNVKLTAKSRFD